MTDFHCDVLSKMLLNSKIQFASDVNLDVTATKMQQGHIGLQCFAIYLPQSLGKLEIGYILEQIDIFQQKLVQKGHISLLQWREEVDGWDERSKPVGLLSIEGADGLEGNLHYVRICYELGVRFLGITWNYANWAADGVMERRNGGFTNKGLELVNLCHKLGIILDVSHLSQNSFWQLNDIAVTAQRPFIASHSNAYEICPHPRNLQNDQINAIISIDGRIGITFVPWFVKNATEVNPTDLLPHLEHICSLGGEHIIMFGSDFDGIENHIVGLEHAGKYAEWAEVLIKHYPEKIVRGWLYGNAITFLKNNLPEKG